MPGWIDDFENQDRTDATCKRCGKDGLEWVYCGTTGWKLYDGMKLHACKRTASVDEFKDIR